MRGQEAEAQREALRGNTRLEANVSLRINYMSKQIRFLICTIIFILPAISRAGETDKPESKSGVVFIHNDREYPAALLEKSYDDRSLPGELRAYVQPGDSFGYRHYQENEIIEDFSGSATDDGRIVFSNGVGFSAKQKTVFGIFRKLESLLALLRSPNVGYLQ